MKVLPAVFVAAAVVLTGCTLAPDESPAIKNCGINTSCFARAVKSCEPAYLQMSTGWQKVIGPSGNDCNVEATLTGPKLQGRYQCRVPPKYMNDNGWSIPVCEMRDYCTGDIADVISKQCQL
ncbi:hypothetical protein HYS54_04855 [Candidatus Micrarchaeota archaeon]|nr:hypothetical protein [Candidatus Micrarchaeota archaeon]